MRRLLPVLVVLVACHHTRKTLVPDVPQNGNPDARARLLQAQDKFLHGGDGDEFAKIVEAYPDDPIVPLAEVDAGVAAVRGRHFADADQWLTKALAANSPDPKLVTRAQLFLGIAKNYEGDTAGALKLLAHADAAINGDDERTEYLAAVAYAMSAEKPADSLPWFDELYERVTPAERALILERVTGVVARLDPDTLARTYDELPDRKGPGVAIAGARLVLIKEQAGDTARAQQLRKDIAPVRAALGLPTAIVAAEVGPVTGGGGQPGLLGAVVPLGGAENRVAERAVAGLALAAGAADGKGIAAVETRAATTTTDSAEAVDQLAQQNVVAIVGPIEGAAVDAAGARAESLGVPLISLSTTPEQRASGPFVFHVRHSAEARARVLAQRAIAAGVTRFLVLAPDNGYGRAIGAAFSDAVGKGGGTIVKTVTYPAATVSFAKIAKGLGSDWQGVFVPDLASTLQLIAPALAAAGMIPKPPGTRGSKKKLGGRPIVLLSTAEDLESHYLAEAGRYSEGAMLAPGFYPDDADPNAKPFIDRFLAAYNRPPSATEAYAYDAAQLAAAAGTGGRSALAAALAHSTLAGVTGQIRFDADHRRADPGIVYTVVEETGGTYAIRVLP